MGKFILRVLMLNFDVLFSTKQFYRCTTTSVAALHALHMSLRFLQMNVLIVLHFHNIFPTGEVCLTCMKSNVNVEIEGILPYLT